MNADDRRDAIVERLADHVLARGLAGASLRPLARAAGTSDRMLLYYFPDKAAVIAAVLERIAARLAGVLGEVSAGGALPLATLCPLLVARLAAADLWPYMQVWLEIASGAARGDALLRDVGERIARGFLAWGAAQLDGPDETRATDAARLLVTIEGTMLLKSLGLDDVCAQADSSATTQS